MKLARVIGQVVSTVKHSALINDKLLLIEYLDSEGKSRNITGVAADVIGAGTGEWVLIVEGSNARRVIANTEAPLDMAIVGIVDEVVIQSKVVYNKKEEEGM